MASVELILAAIGGADLCLKYGKELLEAYRAFKDASEKIRDKVLTVETMWSRTALQVDFLKRVAKTLPEEHCRVQLEVLEMLNTQFKAAKQKIDSVIKKPTRSDGQGGDDTLVTRVRRLKYVIVRDSINETVANLERWQHLFDPTWYLMVRIESQIIDIELAKRPVVDGVPASPSPSSLAPVGPYGPNQTRSVVAAAKKLRATIRSDQAEKVVHVSLPEEGLEWTTAAEVPCSATRTVERCTTGSTKLFAVDSIACGSSNLDVGRARADAEALARKLNQVDPRMKMGILPCHGLVKRRDPKTKRLVSLDLVFRLPPGPQPHPQTETTRTPEPTQLQTFSWSQTPPTSLRQHLLESASFSLTRRLDIARQLAEAVSFVHTCDFVHKNVRPEAVLIFPDIKDDHGGLSVASPLGAAYLLGFDSFRSVSFHTARSGDAAWERNLYRHPLRQGLQAQESYIMQHDVYSLGVCLLELGLWRSFVLYDNDVDRVMKETGEDGGEEEEAGDEDSGPLRQARPSSALGGLTVEDFNFEAAAGAEGNNNGGGGESLAKGWAIKEHLVQLSRTELPARMGDTYTAVVVTCLTCLDKDNEDFGDEEDMCDEDGILIGVRFIEKVLLKLNSISV